MSDLVSSNDATTNMMWMVEQATKPGPNVNAVLRWKQAQKVFVFQKFLRFVSQDVVFVRLKQKKYIISKYFSA